MSKAKLKTKAKPPRLQLKGLAESDSPLLRRRESKSTTTTTTTTWRDLPLGSSILDGNNNNNDDNVLNGDSVEDPPSNDVHVRFVTAAFGSPNIVFNQLNGLDGMEDEDVRGEVDRLRGNSVVPLCELCKEPCDLETVVCDGGDRWHPDCFVCAQCFRPFQDGVFYEFEGRKYCEHDYNTLFAPRCNRCKNFVSGRVIKAMSASWHPECFRCHVCVKILSDEGFVRCGGRPVCRSCHIRERATGLGRHVCYKCHQIIDEPYLKHKGEIFHPYHFNCFACGVELTSNAREMDGQLYCLRCHDKIGVPICGACRRPIEERVVNALGKQWHVEHFVCAKCEKPFLGTKHYEKKGLAYCALHYHQLFGNICFVCNGVINGDVLTAFNKAWCVAHFRCDFCDSPLTTKSKFHELDLRPVCKSCYARFPTELRRRLKKSYEEKNSPSSPKRK